MNLPAVVPSDPFFVWVVLLGVVAGSLVLMAVGLVPGATVVTVVSVAVFSQASIYTGVLSPSLWTVVAALPVALAHWLMAARGSVLYAMLYVPLLMVAPQQALPLWLGVSAALRMQRPVEAEVPTGDEVGTPT